MAKVVIESALRGKTREEQQRNLCYALWCCRFTRLLGHTVYASHTNAPWYLDDSVGEERELGISLTEEITDNSWVHWFFNDFSALTDSTGTIKAQEHFIGELKRGYLVCFLNPERDVWTASVISQVSVGTLRRACWDAFQQGMWPPHTAGFEVAPMLPTFQEILNKVPDSNTREIMARAWGGMNQEDKQNYLRLHALLTNV